MLRIKGLSSGDYLYDCLTRFFLYKNIVYKNIKAEICTKVKNMLRIPPALVEHAYRK